MFVIVAVLAAIAALTVAGVAAPLAGIRASYATAIGSSAVAIIVSYMLLLGLKAAGTPLLGDMLAIDGISALVLMGASVTVALTVLGSYAVAGRWKWGEALPAVAALMLLGITAMAATSNVIALYASWILAAAASYIIVALAKDWVSAEAAVKYGLMGGLASTLLVLGIGYLFATTGATTVLASGMPGLYAVAAAAVLLVAIGYKMGVVPFHGWLPDVYGSARPILVAFVAPAAKAIAVVLLVKLALPLLSATPLQFFLVAALLAAITMTYGNFAAAASNRPQLMLAYSSIAQAGYLLAGIAALAPLAGVSREAAVLGITLHTLGYMFSKAAAFTALDYAKDSGKDEWEAVTGLWKRSPAAALGLGLALASLMGIPPMLGFWGKLYIVLAIAAYAPWLAVIMILNFAVGAYYYGRILYAAFSSDTSSKEEQAPGDELRPAAALGLGLLALLFGLLPQIAALPTLPLSPLS